MHIKKERSRKESGSQIKSQTRYRMMSIGAVTFWLVVTNIALGALTVAFWLTLIVVVIKEIVDKKGHRAAIQGTGSGRMYVSESGIIRGMRRADLESISRN